MDHGHAWPTKALARNVARVQRGSWKPYKPHEPKGRSDGIVVVVVDVVRVVVVIVEYIKIDVRCMNGKQVRHRSGRCTYVRTASKYDSSLNLRASSLCLASLDEGGQRVRLYLCSSHNPLHSDT